MANLAWCEKCDEVHFVGVSCKPMFRVFHEDCLDEDGKLIAGYDAEDAAMNYGAQYNSNGDHTLMDESIIVTVEDSGVLVRFEVSAQPSIEYFVKRLTASCPD